MSCVTGIEVPAVWEMDLGSLPKATGQKGTVQFLVRVHSLGAGPRVRLLVKHRSPKPRKLM